LGKTVSPDELNETTEIITFVEEKLKTKAHRAKQAIDVGVADKVLAENLSVKPKTPLLIIERDYYTRKGSVMFVAITYFRSDIYKYEIELTRT
jgi:DNA-binding GntR family transcriptional regulator